MRLQEKSSQRFFSPSDEGEKSYKKIKSEKTSKLPYIILGLALLIALGAAGFFFFQYNQLKPKVDNPSLAFDEQTKAIKESVGKLILIDSSEEVTLATIQDADKLRTENAEFYKNAKKGDYVLISSKRAILYDKDRNLILNVAPIIPAPESTPGTSTGTPTINPSVAPTPTKK